MTLNSCAFRLYSATTHLLERRTGIVSLLTNYGCKRALGRITSPSPLVLEVLHRAQTKQRPTKRTEPKSLWFHAASLGEAYSLLPLVDRALRATKKKVHFSFNSASALAVIPDALHRLSGSSGRVLCHFLPLDFPRRTRDFLEEMNPCLGVFVESELWPNMINEAKIRGVKLALVNARISHRSLRYWLVHSSLKSLLTEMLEAFDLVYCKSEESLKVLRDLQLSGEYRGDMKSIPLRLLEVPASVAQLYNLIPASTLVWIAGSTHEGEEDVVVQAHMKIVKQFGSSLLTIIAPRHPERAEALAKRIERLGIRTLLRSTTSSSISGSGILLVDTLGELRYLYNRVNVAFVGGSLTSSKLKGGHNLLEPLNAGVNMVLHGPHVDQSVDADSKVQEVNSSVEIADLVHKNITTLKLPFKGSPIDESPVLESIWSGFLTTFPNEFRC